jgi:hypothetical protein
MNNRIFKYNNGFEDVFGDPFEIDTRFAAASMNEDMDLINRWISEVPRDADGNIIQSQFTRGMEALYLQACQRYIPLIRAALEIKPFDKKTGEGMPGDEVLLIWTEYNIFKDKLKKNIEDLPTSATPMDSVPNSSEASPDRSAVPMEYSATRPSMGSPSMSGDVIHK